MSQDPVNEVLESAQQSGLLSAVEATTLSHAMRESGATTKQDVAAKLVEKNVLTQFQAEQLLAGHGRECVLAGRYFIRQQLGAGAMGAVYLADDKKLERRVAIKVLPAQSVTDAGAVARFQREAKALAKLSHPNIVQAYDSDQDASRQFLVMEYAEGTNLGDLIREKGRIAPAVAADYAYQAALGLANAHEKGLVHRDLKPGNLLLTPHGQVKILDLGLARFLQDQIGDATLTRDGTGMGTPDYMAPEQFRDARHVDARSDIYSLGCTLYHLMAGRVPFPGTSMSEKYTAHEQQEPLPLEEFCPDVPTGLALVVQRMMAKRPGDRFQSAREVAEALFPHVAGSSKAVLQIKATASWHGSQLNISVTRSSPRATGQRRAIVAACVAAVLLLAVAYPVFFRRNEPEGNPSGPADARQPPSHTEPPDPNVLTVAQNGSGQFRSINDALANVQRTGMTIRVLDEAEYPELLLLDDARLAQLTLEAIGRATLLLPGAGGPALTIRNTAGVHVKGFRIRRGASQQESKQNLILVTGNSPGCYLENLELQNGGGGAAIALLSLAIPTADPPVVVSQCVVNGGYDGILLRGEGDAEVSPAAAHRVVIRENRISNAVRGIQLQNRVRQCQVTANIVHTCAGWGIQLEDLLPGSADILIANNTCFGNSVNFMIWDNEPHKEYSAGQVEFCNNLSFEPLAADTCFMLGTLGNTKAAGDDRMLTSAWRFRKNWRDTTKMDSKVKPLPLTPEDRKLNGIAFVSRSAGDANFLRPSKDSPLATDGAGGDLPGYVGAVPPEGVEAWDWAKTWDARHPKMLLTVSKEPTDGGEYRSITEALEKVTRPGMTIRVLDSGKYEEYIDISKHTQHAGLTLESPHGALLAPLANQRSIFMIINVENVTVRGFQLRVSGQTQFGIIVGRPCPGLTLEGLDCTGPANSCGVTIEDVRLRPSEEPLRVRNSKFTGFGIGIQIMGQQKASRLAWPCQRILLSQNRISDCGAGILVSGMVSDIHITGNYVKDCGEANVRFVDVFPKSTRILIANNSFKNKETCIEFVAPIHDLREVEIVNNLLLTERGMDILFAGRDQESLPNWNVARNWRQVRPTDPSDPAAKEWMPATNDTVMEKIELVSLDPDSADFLRPAKQAPAATDGTGGDLPSYVGAAPPEEEDPWDWEITWKARSERGEPSR